MIPREILKKIRQLDIGTNWLLESFLQYLGISFSMKYSNHEEALKANNEENAELPKPLKPDYAHLTSHLAVTPRIRLGILQCLADLLMKLTSEPWLSGFIPGDRLKEFRLCAGPEGQFQGSFQPNRFSISASTSSQGTPPSGLLLISASRRSSSAACCGVSASSGLSNPSANSFRICLNSSRFSEDGRFRICSRMSKALMSLTYPCPATRQESFSRFVSSRFSYDPSRNS